MKLLLCLSFLIVLLSSCQKDLNRSMDYMSTVKGKLRDSLPLTIYEHSDFTSVQALDSGDGMYTLRIDVQPDGQSTDFMLLQTTSSGSIIRGRIVSIERYPGAGFQGKILIRSLNGAILTRSAITNGYVEAFHDNLANKTASTTSLEDPYKELPEVIIVSTYKNNVKVQTAWIAATGFVNNNGGANGYYSPYNPNPVTGGGAAGSGGGISGGGGGGGGGGLPLGVSAGTVIKVDYEIPEKLPGIDVNQYVKCFDNIPDDGATCSIEIFADIPVDTDPSKLFDWKNESPGHSFIQLKKQNGSASVQQNIGFYPKTNWKSVITPAPVEGKFADNAGHEFNASFKMTVTAAELRSILANIQYRARFVRYDIDEYNCTDFALQIFNTTRIPKLEIPKYDIPGGEASYGTNTPQGLFQQLKGMKDSKHAEAANITIGIVKGWVGTSKGPCK